MKVIEKKIHYGTSEDDLDSFLAEVREGEVRAITDQISGFKALIFRASLQEAKEFLQQLPAVWEIAYRQKELVIEKLELENEVWV